MISELNRKRLEWLATARAGEIMPEDIWMTPNDWATDMREVAQAALNEIDELNRRIKDGSSTGESTGG
jgi:hypothetical protein